MKFSYLIVLLFLTGTAFAGEIKGKIVDNEDKSPLSYVSVAIYSAENNQLQTGTITTEAGTFSIANIKPGQYYAEFTFIGYEKTTIKNLVVQSEQSVVDIGTIKFHRSVNQLDEIEIVADELAVEYRIDKKVINASQQLTSASGTAVDILQNVPSITVDIDGTVALRGSTGFMVLIDGRPTVMEPSDALRSIPSNSIENIEIITNPSAKYNPDGTAGIINIVTRKNKLQGISGTANLNAGNFGRYGGGALVNFTNSKWNVFLAADLNNGGRKRFNFDERLTFSDNTASYIRSQGDELNDRESRILRGGVGYKLTENDYLSVEFNVGRYAREEESEMDFIEGIQEGQILNRYFSQNYGKRQGNFHSINGLYQHDFEGEEHNLSAQIQYRNRIGEDISTNQMVDADGNISSGQINTEDGPGAVLQTNLDYIRPLGESAKLETGYQSRIGRSTDETTLSWYNPNSGDYELQPEFSNNISYDRNIHSLYGIYATEKGKVGLQAGLRGEYTLRTIGPTATQPGFKLDRFDYFPSAHVSFQLPSEQQAIISYSRRIDRPRSWYLEPFITWQDAFNVRQGSPALLPEYINAFEINYIKGFGNHSFTIESYYRNTQNKVEHIRSVYTDNVMLRRPENVGQDFALGGEVVLNLNLYSWWSLDLSGNFYQYRLDGQLDDQVFDRQSFNWNTRFSTTFRPFEGNRIQINSRYNSRSVTAQGERGDFMTADIAISQEFWKKKMTGILQVRDLFGPVQRDNSSAGDDFRNYGYRYNYAPQVAVTLNYRFNNYKQSKGDRGEEEGDDF